MKNDLGKISAKFEGQGYRSKVKVVTLKNAVFRLFDDLTCVDCADPF